MVDPNVSMYRAKWCGLLLALLLVACHSPSPSDTIANTPKAVSLQWQTLVNNNQFAEAKKWSTDNAKEWLDWIEQKIPFDSLQEMNPPLYIEGTCAEDQLRATCVYLMEDHGELYQDSFFLVKQNGQWLVDLPEENLIEDQSVDLILQELEEIFQEQEAIENAEN